MLILCCCCAQDFEFDGIPKAWLQPMNDAVDELWVPSQFNRDIFVGDGVNGSRVKVPSPLVCIGCLSCQYVCTNNPLLEHEPT